MIINLKVNQKPKIIFFIITGILCLFMITSSSLSFAEDLTLSLSSTSGSLGQTVNLTLNLAYPGTATASAFQLDINYDPDVLENPLATEEQILIDADKQISPSYPSSGVFRMVVAGINQDIILPGDTITVNFDIKLDAEAGQTNLVLSNLAATEPDGQPLDPLGSDGSVTVTASIPTLSEWGMIIFMTVIMGIGVMVLKKRRIV